MSKPSVTTEVWIGDSVRLLYSPDTTAVVIGIYLAKETVTYECAWFAEGERKTAYFTGLELSCAKSTQGRIGFGGRENPARPAAPKGSGA